MQQPRDLPATGDELGEDLYTSATADLSAGGVAMARESAEQEEHASTTTPINDPTPAQIYAREDLVSPTERPTFVTDYSGLDEAPAASRIDPTWAMAAGGGLALGGGIAGAWLYSRWQQRRNRPINRLRRRARGMTSLVADVFDDVGGRLPEVDEVRGTAPMGGGAVGTLILGLALARALHLGGWGQSQPAPSAETLREATRASRRWGQRVQDIDVQAAREKVRKIDVKAAGKKLPKVQTKAARGPLGLGLGGMLGLAAAAFLIWRLLRGGGTTQPQTDWYYGDARREEVPNQ